MENSFTVINFIQVLFILFTKYDSKYNKKISEKDFAKNFLDGIYNNFPFIEKTFQNYIKGETNPSVLFKNDELKDSFSEVLKIMSEETVEFEKNKNYEKCLTDFKEYYETLFPLKKISEKDKKKMEEEIGKFIVNIMHTIMGKDYFYQPLTNQLDSLYKSSKYDIEEIAPCLLDIFLVTLKKETLSCGDENRKAYEKIKQIYEDLKLHPEKYEDDCIEKLLKTNIQVGITPEKFEEKLTEQLQECGIKKEDFLICWLGAQWQISNNCDHCLFEYKCCGAVFAPDGIILYEKVSSNEFTPRKVVPGQKYKWILKSKYHDYVLGYEIKDQKNYPILCKKQEGMGYKLIDNIDWNEVDISNDKLDINFSEEIDEPRYLFILNKETNKFYCCYLKVEGQLKVVNIPELGKMESYKVYTETDLTEKSGYLKPDWTSVTISSVHCRLPRLVQLQFPPDGKIILPGE